MQNDYKQYRAYAVYICIKRTDFKYIQNGYACLRECFQIISSNKRKKKKLSFDCVTCSNRRYIWAMRIQTNFLIKIKVSLKAHRKHSIFLLLRIFCFACFVVAVDGFVCCIPLVRTFFEYNQGHCISIYHRQVVVEHFS